MRDPVYEDEQPVESEEDWNRAVSQDTCAAHVPELVKDSPYRELRVWRCVKCLEPMFEDNTAPWWDR